jgi:hypothetical protein
MCIARKACFDGTTWRSPRDAEINRSVSREHVHILYDKGAGEYRLFNDRWYKREDAGSPVPSTWIVRDRLSQEVPHIARKAVVRFHVK